MESFLEKLTADLNEKLELNLSVFDSSFLERIVSSRMASKSISNADIYLAKLLEDAEEPKELMRLLNNSYSEFFRNPLTFAYLEQIVLPAIFEKKRASHEKEIRIWSAACAGGQEAYSLAILCNELTQCKAEKVSCRIFATDHNADEIKNAQKGIYQLTSLGKVTFDRIQTYFTRKKNTFRVSSRLREIIDFSVFDLLSDHGSSPPASIYGNFDLVFCSNLLFYYTTDFQTTILEKIQNSMAPNGYLATGETEREILKGYNYREVFDYSCLFQKRY
jgi:chemotaxis methyl-accepting protein methylase